MQSDHPGSCVFSALTASSPDADIEAVASLYADAFADNPAYCAIFLIDDPRARRRALAWFFERRLRATLAAGNPFLIGHYPAGGDGVAAAGGLVLPGTRPGLLAMLWHGLALWPWLWGWQSMWRLLDLDRQASSGVVDEHGNEAELVMVAVAPNLRGQGVGSALLARLLERARAAGTGGVTCDGGGGGTGSGGGPVLAAIGTPAAAAGLSRPVRSVKLSTQEAHTVGFYERHGFVARGRRTVVVCGMEPGFMSWTMTKELL